MLTPFKMRQDQNNAEKTLFNKKISTIRVTVEHVMGLLKNRWSSLRGIRLLLAEGENMARVNTWIECTIILHNMMMVLHDDWEYDRVAPAVGFNGEIGGNQVEDIAGVQLRERI